MRGIILAGGLGTRLQPATNVINKHLLPIYDKPMVYYPLSVLMLAGIREILIISTSTSIQSFQSLFGNGSSLGVEISYLTQDKPDGIAQAFLIGSDFIQDDDVMLVLGDNIFFGAQLIERLQTAKNYNPGATIFTYPVSDPQRFGIVEVDDNQKPLNIIEKPHNPKSNQAVTGLYFFNNEVCQLAGRLKPSGRKELEVTDLLSLYLEQNKLSVVSLGRGFTWIDAGTHDSLSDASDFIRMIQKRQGIQVACLEEISYANGWIGKVELEKQAQKLANSDYGKYLIRLVSSL